MTAMLRLYYNEIRTKDASLHCEHKVIANCSLSVRGSFKQTTNISLRSDAETTNFIELTNCWMSNRTPQKFVNSFKFVVSPSKAIYMLSLLIRLADKLQFIGETLTQRNNKYIITLRRGNNEFYRINELLDE